MSVDLPAPEGPIKPKTSPEARQVPELLAAALGPSTSIQARVRGGLDAVLTVSALDVKSPRFRVQAQGALDAAGDASDLTMQVAAPDLSFLGPAMQQDIHGGLDLRARLTGSLQDLKLQAQGKLTRLALADASCDLAQLDVQGRVTPRRIEATANVKAAKLAAGPATVGGVAVEATVSGPPDTLEARAQVKARDIAGQGATFSSLTLGTRASNLPEAPAGDLALEVVGPKGRAALRTRFALDPKAQKLWMRDLALTAPGLRLAANVEADLATGLVSGKLQGGSKDLSPLGAFLGQRLAGQLDVAVSLSAAKGQNLSARIDARSLRALAASAGRLDLSADRRGRPSDSNRACAACQIPIHRICAIRQK